jgi:hypothetical protein
MHLPMSQLKFANHQSVMERTGESHLRLYAFYLEALKCYGIFPFQLTYNSKTKILESVDYHKSGKWAWMNRISIASYFGFSVTCLNSFATCIFSTNPQLNSVNNILGVCFFILTNFATVSGVFHFSLQKRRVCAILNELLRIRRDLVASKFLRTFRSFKNVRNTYIFRKLTFSIRY